ncbi:MAG: tripartite tricarboxylate transporter permease, partial [Geminicoccaceae bacterium]
IVMGLVLGRLAETSFHQALMMTGGSYAIFFERPLAAAMLACSALLIVWPLFRALYRARLAMRPAVADGKG